MTIDIHYSLKYFHVLFVCLTLAEMFSFFGGSGFASEMYSICTCLTAHLEFENWKHILSFVTSLTSTP